MTAIRLSSIVGEMSQIALDDVSALQFVRQEHDRVGEASNVPPGDQSAAEQRASAAQRLAAIGEMTEGIAHDFRNILAIIELGLRLAEKSSEQPDRARVYIAGAREGVNRGLNLTSQLLTFAKQQELETHAGNANDFLRSL